MQARILAIANRKGGTGKSTIAVNLASELGARGYRVLIADLDPQGHAGLGFNISAKHESLTSHIALRDPHIDLSPAICATSETGVDLLPADRNFDGEIRRCDPRSLARALERIRPIYDVILLDSPPAANVIVCALLASEGVLVPTPLDYLSLDGVRQFARAYHTVMVKLHAAQLGIAIAPMQVDIRTNMQKIVRENLWSGFGRGLVMDGIRTDVHVAEAFGHRKSLRQYRMNSRAVGDFSVMADDVSRRFNLSKL